MIPFPFQAGQLGRAGPSAATSPTDPSFASVSLLLHMNGADASTTFTDTSPSPKTATVNGDAQIDTAQSRFGSASYLGDGTGDYLGYADVAAFGFGAGQYTIEGWVRIPALLTTNHYLVDIRKASGNGVGVSLDSLERLIVVNNAATILQGTGALAINTWYHFAVTRDSGNTLRLFLNGALDNSTSDARTMDSTCGAAIGATFIGTASLSGWLDDVRITKGVARYTSAFTPPTNPFPDA